MKISRFTLLTLCATSVYAAPPPPPILTDLSYSSYSTYTPPVASNQVLDNLSKLQSDISQIKNSIADLKARQDKLERVQTYGLQAVNLSASTNVAPHNTAKALPGEKGRYDYAYSVFRSGSYDQAIAEFQSIIKTYPNGEYADNAQYWTGEALLKKGDKQGAMRAFDNVVYAYPRSAKIPDALLKLGMTQYSLGNKTKAKEYYDYLIATYSGTPSANVAYAKRAQAGLY